MQLKSIHLKNIKNHEDLKVDFADGITAIIGKNGEGKTTILESIGFVLFDYLPYHQKDFITYGRTWGQIELEFEIRDSDYNADVKITRRIGNNPKYELVGTGILKDVKWTLRGKEDVQDWLHDNLLIDMDFDKLYSEIIAIPQGLATAHFLLPKTQRAQIFDSIMGVDIYRNCWAKLVKVENILNDEISSNKQVIYELKRDTEGYDEKKSNLSDLIAEIDTLKEMIPVTELAHEHLTKEIDKLLEQSSLDTEKEWLENRLKQDKFQLEEARKELKLISPQPQRKAELKEKIEKLDSQYNAYQAGVMVLNETEKNASSYGNDITNYEKEVKRLQSITLENLCPVTGEGCNIISADKIESINNEIDGIKKTISGLKESYDKENEKRIVLSDGLEKIKKELVDYNELQDEYNEILSKEGSRERLVEHINELIATTDSGEKKINELRDKTLSYDKNTLDSKQDEELELRDTLSRVKAECRQKELQRVSEEQEIYELEIELGKIGAFEEELSRANKTLEKTKKIRKIFNQVGSKLVDNYLNNISYEANLIFQELMNTNESLTWENDYELKVGNKKFNQLSGGQQVSAAISVRLSLLKYFSNIKLIILDEVASNLDNEVKENLIDNIRKLGNYNQILFVSHDDVFQVLGDNVINLSD